MVSEWQLFTEETQILKQINNSQKPEWKQDGFHLNCQKLKKKYASKYSRIWGRSCFIGIVLWCRHLYFRWSFLTKCRNKYEPKQFLLVQVQGWHLRGCVPETSATWAGVWDLGGSRPELETFAGLGPSQVTLQEQAQTRDIYRNRSEPASAGAGLRQWTALGQVQGPLRE